MVGGSRNGSGRGMIRALPPAPARRGKNKGKGVGVGGPWPGERKRVGTGDSDGSRLRLRRTCRPVKISRRACRRGARHLLLVTDGRYRWAGAVRSQWPSGRGGEDTPFFFPSLARLAWWVSGSSLPCLAPGRSLTTPPPSRPLERVVRGSPGSCLRRPAVSAWRAASLAPREILTGFDGAARTPQPLTDSVVPRIISGKSGACHV